jgi:hypothetical protein
VPLSLHLLLALKSHVPLLHVLHVTRQLQVEQSQADSHRVVGAFVTFKDESGKLACLKAQPHSRMRQWWSLKQQHKLRGR